MCIPLNAPGIPFPPALLSEIILVHAPASGTGAGGMPGLAPGAPGPPLRCSIQDAVTSGQSMTRDPGLDLTPFGVARYVLRFDGDPGVIQADQLLVWTGNYWGPLATPIELLSEGPAQPPHGAAGGFIVCATMRI
jgi:hypothetical protein